MQEVEEGDSFRVKRRRHKTRLLSSIIEWQRRWEVAREATALFNNSILHITLMQVLQTELKTAFYVHNFRIEL